MSKIYVLKRQTLGVGGSKLPFAPLADASPAEYSETVQPWATEEGGMYFIKREGRHTKDCR